MTKKIISAILCIILALSLFSACKSDDNTIKLPVAEPNPNITHPEGEFYVDADGNKTAVGGLSAMGTDFLKIMVEGKEQEFIISPEVQRKIDLFNKDKNNLKIMRGTMLKLVYETRDLVNTATDIEIINAN